ncbi:hypothetical protein EAE96_004396 [Botrytis aclada]|nr:hypothetical protein EAE96_004396 [Botrytis aclada]
MSGVAILICLWAIRWGHGEIDWINREENSLWVNVGGEKGHYVMSLRERFGGRERGVGRLVLQDQPHVLEEIGKEIEKYRYDFFFTKQPVKTSTTGPTTNVSKSYIRVLKSAMISSFSKLMIIPESGASTYHAFLDLIMMDFNWGKKRTGKE